MTNEDTAAEVRVSLKHSSKIKHADHLWIGAPSSVEINIVAPAGYELAVEQHIMSIIT